MKLPVSWILEHIKTNKKINESQIIEKLIEIGFEVESVYKYGDVKGPLVIGRVEKIETLTEFKKPIRYCTVNIGVKNVGIVCGASNFNEQDLVVVALPGSELPGEFKISERETYGKKSQGMICSAKELNISDDHSGILVINESIKVGLDAKQILGLNETILDISVLPDRGYAMSIRGIARELASAFGGKFIDPVSEKIPSIKKSKQIKVKIASKNANKIALVLVKDFDPRSQTPLFIQNRLNQCGFRTISLSVDLTNYFMIQMGQPLHAFDANRIEGTIQIRQAKKSEKIETLDHFTRTLDISDLVISDSKKAISLAGVMGGLNSEISDLTKNIVIESAIFNSNSIGATARKHKLPSEASKRFERGTDHKINEYVAIKTAFYLQKYGKAKIEGIALDKKDIKDKVINFDMSQFYRLTGIKLTNNKIVQYLNSLSLVTKGKGNKLKVVIPSWRHDLSTDADLVEEILRSYGYSFIKGNLKTSTKKVRLNHSFNLKNIISNKLSSLGLNEVLNYPFVSKNDLAIANQLSKPVALFNPISENEPYLRTSLFPGLFKALERNISRGQENVQIYEAGHIFTPDKTVGLKLNVGILSKPSKEAIEKLNNSLPEQPYVIASLLKGSTKSFGAYKANVELSWQTPINYLIETFHELSIEVRIANGVYKPFHPGRCAVFSVDDLVLGYAGEMHPKISEQYGIKGKVFGFEIHQSNLLILSKLKQAPVFSSLPVVKEDLAFIFDISTKAEDVVKTIRSINPSLIESVSLFDVYEGANLPNGKKSLAFSIRLRAYDKTLKTEEVQEIRNQIIHKVESDFGAQLR